MNTNKAKLRPIALAVILSLSASGCATTQGESGIGGIGNTIGKQFKDTFNNDDPCANSKRNIGMAVGAVVGGLIGSKVADKNKLLGLAIGAAAGAGVGALIGHELDYRTCEISKIQKKYNADIQVTPLAVDQTKMATANTSAAENAAATQDAAQQKPDNVGLSVNVVDKDGKPQFTSNSADIQPEARAMFTELARTYITKPGDANAATAAKNRRVLLIGHTDDTGNSKLNADLSERRALEVAKLFREAGVPDNQIYYQGAGETLPIASNDTPEGQAKNRRVEIVDLSDDDLFQMYLDNRRPATAFYRSAESQKQAIAAADTASSTPATTVENKKAPKSKKSKKDATVTSSSSPTATQTTQSTSAASSPSSGIDFGGQPFTKSGKVVDIGTVTSTKSGVSLINEAHADNGPILTCDLDRPRYSGAVKSLKTGREYRTNQYLPGAYNSSWAGMVNGNLVALTHVAVLRDGASPVGNPEVLIYKNYRGNSADKPFFKGAGEVNAYRGDKALLYRVFSDGPVKCVDVMIPTANPSDGSGSELLYDHGKTLYSASYNPKIAK